MKLYLFCLGLTAACGGAVSPPHGIKLPGRAPSSYWYEQVKHNGASPGHANYSVFRNVKSFGAKGDGVTDDTAAIQSAINAGDGAALRTTSGGSYGAAAVVYFPPGTYMVSSGLKNYVYTQIMGDPTNRPMLKATTGFTSKVLITGDDGVTTGLGGFFYEIKNLILDSTAVASSKSITLLTWSLSQACQVSNVQFNMPVGATGHIGISSSGMNSPLLLNDLQFFGGAIGYSAVATQYHFKSIYFKNVGTGLKLVQLLSGTGQDLRFEGCTIGIDTSANGSGIFNLIDTTASNTTTLVNAGTSTTAWNSLLLENVIVDSSVPSTIKVGDSVLLTGSVKPGQTWIRGNIYTSDSTNLKRSDGAFVASSRPSRLINSTGFYYTVVPPTYAEIDVSNVVNVKDVSSHPVSGNGVADDTASLQAIIDAAAAAGQLVYFPYGVYRLTDTLLIPMGSRLVGEVFTQFTPSGTKFADAKSPRPMIRVGNPGDVGLAQMTDFLFAATEILPGSILVEVNMAGTNPGDVGFFNCHFSIGLTSNSKIGSCARPASCNAAHIAAHFTSSSSVYWENSWATAATIPGGTSGVSPGGGFLVESQNGTWMVGVGIEHYALYQLNIYRAKNVFVGIQVSESSYWQVSTSNALYTPAPWTDSLLPGEPDFAWCTTTDKACRVGVYQRVVGSSNINLYSGGFWNFPCSTDACQANAVIYENNTKLYSYGLSVINSKNIVVESGVGGDNFVPVVPRSANVGINFNGLTPSIMAAYLRQTE